MVLAGHAGSCPGQGEEAAAKAHASVTGSPCERKLLCTASLLGTQGRCRAGRELLLRRAPA
jgi:hypothetical protein